MLVKGATGCIVDRGQDWFRTHQSECSIKILYVLIIHMLENQILENFPWASEQNKMFNFRHQAPNYISTVFQISMDIVSVIRFKYKINFAHENSYYVQNFVAIALIIHAWNKFKVLYCIRIWHHIQNFINLPDNNQTWKEHSLNTEIRHGANFVNGGKGCISRHKKHWLMIINMWRSIMNAIVCDYSDLKWGSWYLKSLATQPFVQ